MTDLDLHVTIKLTEYLIVGDCMEEIWKDIKGYEGIYQVSNLGRVFSVRRKLIMKPQKSGKGGLGYYQVPLTVGGKKYLAFLHKLIAEAFIPNPDNKPHVNHIDGNKKNNELSNLEWCTLKENSKHAYDTGLNRCLKKGEEHYKSKLNADIVREIRRLYATGMYSQKKLSEMYKIHQTNVGFIVRMETWKDV